MRVKGCKNMVFYYSATQKSEAYAKLLGEMLNLDVYELKCALDASRKLSFYLAAVFKKSQSAITNMPKHINTNEIYLVGPVWAGDPARPLKYFLKNAPLEGKRVNILLTAMIADGKHALTAENFLSQINCIPGEAHVFATPKTGLDKEIAEVHIRKLFNV